MKPLLQPIMTWLAHHIGVGSVIGWAGHHRWHHLHADTKLDLHSPTEQGITHIIFGVWDANIPRSLIKDLLKDKKLLAWHKNYFRYHLALIFILMIISPTALIYVYCVPNLLCLLSGYILAILPHTSGQAKNSVMAEFFTFGEGWHKYHHDFPQEYRFSQWDVTGYSIRLLLMES